MSNAKEIRQEEVAITLKDGVHYLLFDLNAMVALEEAYGSIDEAMEEAGKGSLKAVRTVLWAGLIHEDEERTEKEVGSLIPMAQFAAIASSLADALTAFMPDEQEVDVTGEETEGNPQGSSSTAGTGATSTTPVQ